MTMAGALRTPGHLVVPTYSKYGSNILTVTDEPGEEKLYTAAELLETVLAAYERGLAEGYANICREHWRDPDLLAAFRSARKRTETIDMKWRSDVRHTIYGYPDGYDYRGGAVDWMTGMPEGSACAWLRRQRLRNELDLAGGHR